MVAILSSIHVLIQRIISPASSHVNWPLTWDPWHQAYLCPKKNILSETDTEIY